MIQSDFITVTALTKPQLHQMLSGQSFDTAMEFRKETQRALTTYAKSRGSQGAQIDHVQEGALRVLHAIESWCRQAFYTRRMAEILTQEAGLMKRTKKAAKWLVRKEWEELASRRAY